MSERRRWMLWRDKDIDGHWLGWWVGDDGNPMKFDPHAAERVEVMPVAEHNAVAAELMSEAYGALSSAEEQALKAEAKLEVLMRRLHAVEIKLQKYTNACNEVFGRID